MKPLGGVSRAELFARLDEPVLLPLPAEPFVYSEWLRSRVHPDRKCGQRGFPPPDADPQRRERYEQPPVDAANR